MNKVATFEYKKKKKMCINNSITKGPEQQIVLLRNAIYLKRMLKANELCLTK